MAGTESGVTKAEVKIFNCGEYHNTEADDTAWFSCHLAGFKNVIHCLSQYIKMFAWNTHKVALAHLASHFFIHREKDLKAAIDRLASLWY